MELDKYQRLVLANQYRILERLARLSEDGEHEAESFAKYADAVEEGYAAAIESLFEHIFDGLSREDCSLVIMSMAMFDALQRSYDALPDKSGVKEYAVNSFGFDGNHETEYMAYARFVIEKEQRFTRLRNDDNCNSHMPNVARYRAMVETWKDRYDQSYDLNANAINDILSVR